MVRLADEIAELKKAPEESKVVEWKNLHLLPVGTRISLGHEGATVYQRISGGRWKAVASGNLYSIDDLRGTGKWHILSEGTDVQ